MPDGRLRLGDDNETLLRIGGTTELQFTVGASGVTARIESARYNDTLTFGDQLTFMLWFNPFQPLPGSPVIGLTEVRVNGRVGSTTLAGSFTIGTLNPVVQHEANAHPSGGRILVTGSNSKLRITPVSATTVQLELDDNGDDAFGAPTLHPWSEIL